MKLVSQPAHANVDLVKALMNAPKLIVHPSKLLNEKFPVQNITPKNDVYGCYPERSNQNSAAQVPSGAIGPDAHASSSPEESRRPTPPPFGLPFCLTGRLAFLSSLAV